MAGLKVGGNVDSWCGRCKMLLAHTIEAMVGSEPARVQCNTCHQQHNYKGHAPGAAPTATASRAKASGPVRPRSSAGTAKASQYQDLLKTKNMALSKRYTPKDKFVPGDVVEHPNFGVGVATAFKDGSKIEVLFEDGPKVLVHAR